MTTTTRTMRLAIVATITDEYPMMTLNLNGLGMEDAS